MDCLFSSSKTHAGKIRINIGTSNVCGLASKCHVPDFFFFFFDFVESIHIVGIQESKTDDSDTSCILGYQIFYNNREKLSRRRSGE